MKRNNNYDIIIIGAGHAGCEAAYAVSKLGCSVLLLTMNIDTIAQMSCNPAIGGMGKGHIVREIDALGGIMAHIIDKAGIHFRMLNTKKGPAVQAPRAQADKKLYQQVIKDVLSQQNKLEIKQQEVVEILTEHNKIKGVKTNIGIIYYAHAVVLAAGTFLNGVIHIGKISFNAGRIGEFSAVLLAQQFTKLGINTGRLKTGTPARVDSKSIDYTKLTIQLGDEDPQPFSFITDKICQKQIPCYIGYTNSKTHKIIRDNLKQSALYGGKIKGTGVRYCPSIEDKVVKFPDKQRHQIFFEPEGRTTNEIYLNGVSTSMPAGIQEKFLRTINGLKNIKIIRYGYAIEYDYYPPTQLKPTLESKLIDNLYFAGQVNGTTGYEEAAGQGLIAGINAVHNIKKKPPVVLTRDQAFIGVLIDDLVTKGTKEPYRMFTSRAEHRLILRQDNADLRLTKIGYELGLIDKQRHVEVKEKRKFINEAKEKLNKIHSGNTSFYSLLKRPNILYSDLVKINKNVKNLSKYVAKQVEIEIKYEGYIQREALHIAMLNKLEDKKILEDMDYNCIHGLKKEAREKLSIIKPRSLGQASRISGVSPCDLSLLLVYLRSADKLAEEHSC
ncbi:MAG: tRNA uridine-5-carboxymethylaminomethyl(34) synthesis enzyme MnmG [Candidatus Omnitrophota bacterium]